MNGNSTTNLEINITSYKINTLNRNHYASH
jgi:hypothetical protein